MRATIAAILLRAVVAILLSFVRAVVAILLVLLLVCGTARAEEKPRLKLTTPPPRNLFAFSLRPLPPILNLRPSLPERVLDFDSLQTAAIEADRPPWTCGMLVLGYREGEWVFRVAGCPTGA